MCSDSAVAVTNEAVICADSKMHGAQATAYYSSPDSVSRCKTNQNMASWHDIKPWIALVMHVNGDGPGSCLVD